MSIFSRKSGGRELQAPFAHGQTGFRVDPDQPELRAHVIYDDKKGCQCRRPSKEGGAIYEVLPGWVSLEEFNARKEARSRYWKKSKGPANYVRSFRRRSLLAERGSVDESCYGDRGHPHEGTTFVVRAA